MNARKFALDEDDLGDVEAKLDARISEQPEPVHGTALDEALLVRPDCICGAAKGGAGAGLYLNKREHIAVPGDDVHLHLAAANRDPARFTEPERFNPDRAEGGHLAFGRGRHACAGAQLIRHAAQSATAALLAECRAMTPAGDPDWLTGPAIAAPVTLPVVVSH